MLKLNVIQFAAGLSIDFTDEINDLDAMIKEARQDEAMIDEVVRSYRHLSSFLQGIDYMIDYMEDDESKEQLKALSDTTWHGQLQSFWATIMEMKWSRTLDEKVHIVTHYLADGKIQYEVTTKNGTETCKTREKVADYLKSIEGV